MESLAIIFVVGIFVAIISPRQKPSPKKPWVKFGEAVDEVLRDILNEETAKKVLKQKKDPPPKSNDLFWVIAFSTLIGMLVLFGG